MSSATMLSGKTTGLGALIGLVGSGFSRAFFKRVQFSLAESSALAKRVFAFLQLLWWLLKALVCMKVRPQQHSYAMVSLAKNLSRRQEANIVP